MSSISSALKISKWNEELYDPENLSKPQLVDYFTVNNDFSKFSKDIDFLKYYDSNAVLNISSMKSKFADNPAMNNITLKNETSLPIKKLFKDSSANYLKYVDIITSPSIISTIMNTPFELNGNDRKWKFSVTVEGNKIFLLPYVQTVYKCKYNGYQLSKPCICNTYEQQSNCRANRITSTQPEVSKHYDLLKRYLFVRKPDKLHRKIISKWDKLLYEVYLLNIGGNQVLYLTEIPGVVSENKLNSFEELKESGHIYCDICEVGEFTQELINYNPVWWSRAYLVNAKQCFIGNYNDRKDGLQEIINFNSDKFDDTSKYENLWSPNAAWNFLNDVLSFIKCEVNRIDAEYRSSCTWIFSSYADDKPFVTVQAYGPGYSAMPNNYIS